MSKAKNVFNTERKLRKEYGENTWSVGYGFVRFMSLPIVRMEFKWSKRRKSK